jgi:hypothetical protein
MNCSGGRKRMVIAGPGFPPQWNEGGEWRWVHSKNFVLVGPCEAFDVPLEQARRAGEAPNPKGSGCKPSPFAPMCAYLMPWPRQHCRETTHFHHRNLLCKSWLAIQLPGILASLRDRIRVAAISSVSYLCAGALQSKVCLRRTCSGWWRLSVTLLRYVSHSPYLSINTLSYVFFLCSRLCPSRGAAYSVSGALIYWTA